LWFGFGSGNRFELSWRNKEQLQTGWAKDEKYESGEESDANISQALLVRRALRSMDGEDGNFIWILDHVVDDAKRLRRPNEFDKLIDCMLWIDENYQ